MRKFSLLLLSCIFSFLFADSQQLYPTVLSSGGDVAKTSDLSIEWTLGEFAVETIYTGKSVFTQGFHQPILDVKSYHSPPEFNFITKAVEGVEIKVFPNPAESFINVLVQDEKNDAQFFSLYDLSGKKILSRQGNGHNYSMKVEVGKLASGVYLLDVRNKRGDVIGIYKIVKAE